MLDENECRRLQAELRQLLNTEDVDISVEDQCAVLPLSCLRQLLTDINNGRFS